MRKLTRRQRLSAIVLTIVALCFLTLDLGGGSLGGAHSGVRGALGSLYRGTDAVLGPARRWVQGVPSAGTHESEIRKLEKQNAQLRGRLDVQRADGHTSAELAKLQRAADGGDHIVLPARVIAYGPGQGFDWTVTIDAGTHDGIRIDQSVTDGAGLVGRVLHADADTAVVLLAADPGSGVGARDVRNNELGVATGDGPHGFVFAPLTPDAAIRIGDVLVTGPSGATSYVVGMSVGTVTAVTTSADGTTRATVRPTSSPTAVDLVGVITSPGTARAARSPLVPGGR
ncbi:MAG: rod shape-determining protein MreC [Jatrophihabitans sp.]